MHSASPAMRATSSFAARQRPERPLTLLRIGGPRNSPITPTFEDGECRVLTSSMIIVDVVRLEVNQLPGLGMDRRRQAAQRHGCPRSSLHKDPVCQRPVVIRYLCGHRHPTSVPSLPRHKIRRPRGSVAILISSMRIRISDCD